MDNQKIQEHVNDLKVMARQFSPIVGNVLIGAAEALEQQQREIERLRKALDWIEVNFDSEKSGLSDSQYHKQMLEIVKKVLEDTNG